MGQFETAVRQARQTDLAEWLRRNGEPLKRRGRWWYIEGSDSLRIQGNKWYRNSQGIGGNAIDFLVSYYGMSPKEAITELTNNTLHPADENSGVNKKNLKAQAEASTGFDISSAFIQADNQRRALAYLIKARGIDADIAVAEIRKGQLFQEAGTGNAVFAMTDEADRATGAEVIGTLSFPDSRFKGIKAGSEGGCGYSVGQKQNPRYILYFESAVDLLSFITIKRRQKKSMTECLLISMAGLKLDVVHRSLSVSGNPAAIPVLCVDNDKAGDMFVDRCISLYPRAIVKRPDKGFKDWNDQLLNISAR